MFNKKNKKRVTYEDEVVKITTFKNGDKNLLEGNDFLDIDFAIEEAYESRVYSVGNPLVFELKMLSKINLKTNKIDVIIKTKRLVSRKDNISIEEYKSVVAIIEAMFPKEITHITVVTREYYKSLFEEQMGKIKKEGESK